MFSYKPVILGFVVDLSAQTLPAVKHQVIECVRHLEADDRCYVYHPDDLEMAIHAGPVVAAISNYMHPQDFDLEIAIKQTILMLGMEDQDTDKYIFALVDKYPTNWEHQLKNALRLDLKENARCQFTFFNFSKHDVSKLEEFHPKCKCLNVEELNTLSEKIVEMTGIDYENNT